MMEQKTVIRKLNVKCLTIFIIAITSLFFCFISFNIGFNNKKQNILFYNNLPNVEYKVYLKDNNFFQTEYLEMGRTYIASLIDYIDVNLKNTQSFTSPITGEYEYYIRGIIYANKNNDESTNYWSKTIQLSDPKKINLKKDTIFNVNSNVKIDYEKYSKLLQNFRNEYGLSIDGNLKIELIVHTVGKTDKIDKEVNIFTKSDLTIPLTEKAIELSFKTNNSNNNGSIIQEFSEYTTLNKIFIIIGIVFLIVILICTIYILKRAINIFGGRTKYNKELKKILTTYDSIIVNVANLPNTDNVDLILVNSFQELLDAHSEVRMPINYIENVKNMKCTFLLINNNVAWKYVLIDDTYKKLD